MVKQVIESIPKKRLTKDLSKITVFGQKKKEAMKLGTLNEVL